MNRRLTTLMLLTLLTISPVSAQSSYGAIRNSIAQHFAQYHCNSMDLKNVRVSHVIWSSSYRADCCCMKLYHFLYLHVIPFLIYSA